MFEWITAFIAKYGILAIFGLMVIENYVPFMPSELVLPLGGFEASQGEFHVALAILAASTGSILGSFLWYWAGVKLGKERLLNFAAEHGAWLTLEPEEIEKGLNFFDRHHKKGIFLARLVPGLRTIVAIPAGIVKVPFWQYALLSFSGTLVWDTALTFSGYILKSQYHVVGDYLDPVTNVFLALAIAYYLYRVVQHKRKHRDAKP